MQTVCSIPSAGITRIRYAGRGLSALLSARQHRAPLAGLLVILMSIRLDWAVVKRTIERAVSTLLSTVAGADFRRSRGLGNLIGCG